MDVTVLVVDDEKNTRDGLRMSLEDSFDVYVAADIAGAMEVLKSEQVDIVLTDLRLAGESGMDLLGKVLALPEPPICIVMTAYGSVDLAVDAMRQGAYDFITKPLNIDELEMLLKRALRGRSLEKENRVLKAKQRQERSFKRLLGRSAPMAGVMERIEQVAPTRATVLVEGESGTGKELAAHALHELSGRKQDGLVIVHCAALSPQLLESELFGHEKGAFTGASTRRIGRIEQAQGGTLFLDEIGEIDESTQVKLLRVLGERTIERVGGNESIKVDVRVVAATNRDLQAMVEKGEFREDLYFRLNVVHLTMPPLRARREDILMMATTFLEEFSRENNREVRPLSDAARQCLLDYGWPGNVRELRTAMEHAVVLATGDQIEPRDLPDALTGGRSLRLQGARDATPQPPSRDVPDILDAGDSGDDMFNLEAMERRLISRALARCKDNRTEAAKLLGISRRTLQRKLKDL
ncbi:sigma-54-dependent transcriptional regulator [Sulfuriroseicoccus oceanibius]|uniref:Sigma-54-dependent Fis family transcriptional regulator n=1 Tax=Sulfuriroseicoccus oceanibius TaxID=2707525 RepID=A0A6B3L312_9BACT|nr:sigma-54 dependent transcriptional regulator [Sulfuriroseicoccus oceanibius]QQL45325.1 sigma-54-dependent Fis family transcriptional regulator [Sulfuriroseicoccus oceanibius]